MTDPKLDEVLSWLRKARQDLDAAAWLLESPQALFGAVGLVDLDPISPRQGYE